MAFLLSRSNNHHVFYYCFINDDCLTKLLSLTDLKISTCKRYKINNKNNKCRLILEKIDSKERKTNLECRKVNVKQTVVNLGKHD